MAPQLPRFLFKEAFKTDFTLQNLPYGVFKRKGASPLDVSIGVAIGNKILNMRALARHEMVPLYFAEPFLNVFMAEGRQQWREIREKLQNMLSDNHPSSLKHRPDLLEECIVEQSEVEMCMPCLIGDYTDFYASKEHATNIGTMWRSKEQPLLPNWTSLPVGYHGRASTIYPSGTPVKRPCGQIVPMGEEKPIFGPSRVLDFELEMASFVGVGNTPTQPIPISEARDRIFGLVLMNDWSARDIQRWEYQPLGPFLGKSFGTTISPWIVTLDALEPFAAEAPVQDPKPLEYLRHAPGDAQNYDVKLEVAIKAKGSQSEDIVTRSNLKYMYWTLAQQLTHHASNGCYMKPGDLLGTGTISGPDKSSYGSMVELTWAGKESVKLSNGVERKFIEDGDEVILRGYCEKDDMRIGFGECRSIVLPAEFPVS